MRREQLHINNGFSLVEILVSISIFLIFVISTNNVFHNVSIKSHNTANRERASILAEEGVEAIKNIRNADFANLIDGTYGLSTSGNIWSLSGSSDVTNIFKRVLVISTINDNQKKVVVTVSWSDEVSATNSLTLSTYLTNWRAILNTGVGLTVNKSVINHGGTSTASDFAPYKVDGTVISLGVANSFPEGSHTVTESSNTNYTQTFSGDCDASGVVNLVANTVATCLITNEEKPSKLVVNKVVINHGGNKVAGDFSLLVDTNPVTSGVVNTFNSGIHNVSEVSNPAYTGTTGGDCALNGSVTLSPGTTKTCTITNEEIVYVPTVTSPTVASITGTTAILGANVTSLGVPNSITRGTCYGTTPNPTTNCVAEGGTTTGTFTQNRTGLIPGTLYYYRGYATNATGTGYSPDGTFTTLGGACITTGIIPTNYDNSASTSAVVAKPTGVVQNDIMFAYIMHNNATDRLNTIPAGWIQIGRHKNGNSNQALYYKVAGANEPASYTFGLSANSRFAITINAYRGCFNTINPIDTISNVEYVVNNTTYRAASMTLPSAYSTIIIFPSVNTSGSKTFAAPLTQGGGWVQDYANGNSSSQFSRNAYSKMMTPLGVTGDIDSIGAAASTGKHAFAVGLKPL